MQAPSNFCSEPNIEETAGRGHSKPPRREYIASQTYSKGEND